MSAPSVADLRHHARETARLQGEAHRCWLQLDEDAPESRVLAAMLSAVNELTVALNKAAEMLADQHEVNRALTRAIERLEAPSAEPALDPHELCAVCERERAFHIDPAVFVSGGRK